MSDQSPPGSPLFRHASQPSPPPGKGKKKLIIALCSLLGVLILVAVALPLTLSAAGRNQPSASASHTPSQSKSASKTPAPSPTPTKTKPPTPSRPALPAPNGVYQQPATPPGSPMVATDPATITVTDQDAGHDLKPGLDGLSLELTDLADPAVSADNPSLVGLVSQLNGPMLRFGGNSVERRAFWSSTGEALPARVQGSATQPARVITPQDLQRVEGLLQATNSTIVLVVDLASFDPARAADFIANAHRIFGDRLIGYTPGNEPNGYEKNGMRPVGWGTAGYAQDAQAYSKAIAAVAPTVPIVGPGTYEISWARVFVDTPFDSPKIFAFHHYPFSSCEGADPNGKPTVANMLNPAIRANSIGFRENFMKVAVQAKLPVWEPEMGPSACPGNQQEFTKQHVMALWAVDYALSSAQLGIDRLGFHSSLAACVGGPSMSPVCNTGSMTAPSGVFAARPNFWGEAFVSNLTPGKFAKIDTSGDAMTYSYAIRSNENEVSVVVINTNDPQVNAPTQANITLPFDAQRGTMAQLSGPSYTAQNATVIDGQEHVMVPEDQRPGIPGFKPGNKVSIALNAGTATVLTFRR